MKNNISAHNPNYHFHEHHYMGRAGWLRAAVLGANDGIISVSSLIMGVAAASVGPKEVMIAGVASLVAGAMSMAAGEYVSVSSQSDLENSEIERERKELQAKPDYELHELAHVYVERGVEPDLALEVAKQMTAKDALGAHVREELGISEMTAARPLQAAIASAASFSAGASFPVLSVLFIPRDIFVPVSSVLCVLLLGILGAVAAMVGKFSPWKPAFRVMFWGAMAMGFTALIGSFFGQTGL